MERNGLQGKGFNDRIRFIIAMDVGSEQEMKRNRYLGHIPVINVGSIISNEHTCSFRFEEMIPGF